MTVIFAACQYLENIWILLTGVNSNPAGKKFGLKFTSFKEIHVS